MIGCSPLTPPTRTARSSRSGLGGIARRQASPALTNPDGAFSLSRNFPDNEILILSRSCRHHRISERARRSIVKLRVCHQPQDRKGARPQRSAAAARSRRRGDRINYDPRASLRKRRTAKPDFRPRVDLVAAPVALGRQFDFVVKQKASTFDQFHFGNMDLMGLSGHANGLTPVISSFGSDHFQFAAIDTDAFHQRQ